MQSTKQIVQRLIKRHGTNDPTTIARKMGILILFEDFKNIWGYFNMSKRVPMIHVNRNLDEHLQRFVIAHELGHSIQHPSADLKAVQERLGHSKYQTTADLYAHVTKKMSQETAKKLAKFDPRKGTL
ncbi:ImmA/IrrE family metallo-endopeptidase [Brevibacillus parabrevis]|uniref:ImmA/IrrE family metallo-endopeptidase n=1 Tax=Brevibacillus parabrevis TaxID=54914 RepID=UPI0009FF7DD2|nr:ImmA/IrrE family metallo-endopeptidase [Brevibacillus parabrevis]